MKVRMNSGRDTSGAPPLHPAAFSKRPLKHGTFLNSPSMKEFQNTQEIIFSHQY